jgi:hypothetical protein
MLCVGDIVGILAPTTGYRKYHICILVGKDGAASQFLFLNSDPSFDGTYAVDCARVPCLPPSKTGKTVVSFAMLPRYNDRQLALYKAEKLGVLDAKLAGELYDFAKTVPTLTGRDRRIVLEALALVRDGS